MKESKKSSAKHGPKNFTTQDPKTLSHKEKQTVNAEYRAGKQSGFTRYRGSNTSKRKNR